MKVNLHTAFRNAQGTEAYEMVNGEKKPQMIDDTVCVGLFNGTFIKNGGNEDDTARKKLEAFELYRKIRDAKGEVEISTEEATLIKKVAQLLSPGAYGQIYNIIEGKE